MTSYSFSRRITWLQVQTKRQHSSGGAGRGGGPVGRCNVQRPARGCRAETCAVGVLERRAATLVGQSGSQAGRQGTHLYTRSLQ